VRLACKGGGSIERAADRQAAALKHVGVDHGGATWSRSFFAIVIDFPWGG
jgi:hypothetical protein